MGISKALSADRSELLTNQSVTVIASIISDLRKWRIMIYSSMTVMNVLRLRKRYKKMPIEAIDSSRMQITQ